MHCRWSRAAVLLVVFTSPAGVARGDWSDPTDSQFLGLMIRIEAQPSMTLTGVLVSYTPSSHDSSVIARGDIIVSMGGVLLPNGERSMREVWADALPGRVEFVRLRDGKFTRYSFLKPSSNELSQMGFWERRAIEYSPIPWHWARSAEVSLRVPRVSVVNPGSRAHDSGVRPGDVIYSIHGDHSVLFHMDWLRSGLNPDEDRELSIVAKRGTNYRRISILARSEHQKRVREQNLHALTFANTTPFEIRFSVFHAHREPTRAMSGWLTIKPGQVWSESIALVSSDGRDPRYYVFARTVDEDKQLVRWLYADMIRHDEEAILQWPNQNYERPDYLEHVVSDAGMPISSDKLASHDHPSDAYVASFMAVGASPENARHYFRAFAVPKHGGLSQLQVDENDAAGAREASVEARLLSESLRRQMRVNDALRAATILPVGHGLAFDATDDVIQLGVRVTTAVPFLPLGEPNPIQPGDVILSFRGRPVYGALDVWGLLFEHAGDRENGGIDRPITFVVRRPGEDDLIQGVTTYWFNKNYSDRHGVEMTQKHAAIWGVWDGTFMGAGEYVSAGIMSIRTGKPLAECTWLMKQHQGALNQWFGDTVDAAGLVTVLFSLPRALLKKAPSRMVSGMARSLPGGVAIEIGEQIVWSVLDKSAVATTKDLKEELKYTIPIAAAGAVVPGVFKKMVSR